MYFGLAQEISEDLFSKTYVITQISQFINNCLKDKNYGSGLETIVIGTTCVNPEINSFFVLRKTKYTKSKKLIEYDVKLDYQKVKAADENELRKIVSEKIMNSVEIIENKRIKYFNFKQFKNDLENCIHEFMQG